MTVLGAWSGTSSSAPAAGRSERPRAADPLDLQLWTNMRNVDLRVGANGAMRVRSLRGRVLPTTAGEVPFLDEPASFQIEVTSGTVALDGTTMSTLMNERVFNYRGAPIRNLTIRFENGQIVQRGIIHKGVDLRFEMWGDLSATPDGWARIRPTKLRLMGVNGLALLHALGLKLEKVIDVSGTNGIMQIEGDDMLVDPLRLIPPPSISGRIATMRVEGAEIVQTFVRTPEDAMFESQLTPDTSVHNYIYYRGGQLRFGKLLMTPTDLLIRDPDESDPLDLDLARYERQLTAGYTRTLPGGALRAWMPDLTDLDRGALTPLVAGTERTQRPK